MPLQKKTNKPVKEARGGTAPGKSDKPSNDRNGKQTKPAPQPSAPSDAKVQIQAFERAIQFLHQRNYRDAMAWFEKAGRGSVSAAWPLPRRSPSRPKSIITTRLL